MIGGVVEVELGGEGSSYSIKLSDFWRDFCIHSKYIGEPMGLEDEYNTI